MSAITLFASTFALVFLLGLQSRNVNCGQRRAAFFTSLGIGSAQLLLYKLAPDANGLEIAAYLSGGPFGIVASMWAHERFFNRKTAVRMTLNSGITTQGERPCQE